MAHHRFLRPAAGIMTLACGIWLGMSPSANATAQAVLHLTAVQGPVGSIGTETTVDLALHNDGPARASAVKVAGKVVGSVKSVTVTGSGESWKCTTSGPGTTTPAARPFECTTDALGVNKTDHLGVGISTNDHWLVKVSLNDLQVTAGNIAPNSTSPAGDIAIPLRGTPGGLAGTTSTLTSTAKPAATSWKSVTFPISFSEFPNSDGYYVAQQFGFTNREDSAYTGLQPFPGGTMHALFSVFGPGSEIVDSEHCTQGADGGSGTSCNVSGIPLVRGDRYELTVVRDQPAGGKVVWRGYLRDASATSGQERIQIGAWRLAASAGDLKGDPGAFVEYYQGGMSCENLPHLDVTFGAPLADSTTATTTTREYGECSGEEHYWAKANQDGSAEIKVGRDNK